MASTGRSGGGRICIFSVPVSSWLGWAAKTFLGPQSILPSPWHFFHVLDKILLYRIIWESREALGLKPLDLQFFKLCVSQEKDPR